MLGDERRELILAGVVVGVRQRTVAAAVVEVVEPLDLGGQLGDAIAYVHSRILPHASAG
jgi:hypothetical protein